MSRGQGLLRRPGATPCGGRQVLPQRGGGSLGPALIPGFKLHGIVRVWEEVGGHAEITLRNPDQVLDLIEVLTAKEAAERKHDLPWACGERREGWSFVCQGFVTAARRSQRRYIGAEKGRPWRRSGASDENFPDMRGPCVSHNVWHLPFVSLPTSVYVDNFNAWGMTNAVCSKG